MTDKKYYKLEEFQARMLETPDLDMNKFYRQVRLHNILKHPDDLGRKRGIRYDAETIERFLRGEFSKDHRVTKNTGTLRKTSITVKQNVKPQVRSQKPSKDTTSIDLVSQNDLPAIGYMEATQLGWQQAVPATVILSWLKKNEHLYWMKYDTRNRRGIDGVHAILGILPLRDEVIQKLISKEIVPNQITENDILIYEQGNKYSCFVVSTTAIPGQQATRLLLQQALAYWCENSIEISRLYALVDETRESTPTMHLIAESFFTPLSKDQPETSAVWSLLFNKYNPSSSVQEYQRCVNRKNMGRGEDNIMSNTLVVNEPAQLTIEKDLEGLYKKKQRDFDKLDGRLYKVGKGGRLDAERLKEEIRFRRVQSDTDIRACLEINASLFGESKKYTYEELIAQRKTWLEVNPDIYRVLEVDSKIVGFISAFPLPMPTIDKILSSEIKPGDLGIDQIQPYKPGVRVSIYLQTIGVHKQFQGIDKRRLGMFMASGFRDAINSFGRNGIELDAIYTRSDEPDGISMSYSLGFQRIDNIPGVEKMIFKLDFSRNDLPFLFEYRQELKQYQIKQSACAIRNATH